MELVLTSTLNTGFVLVVEHLSSLYRSEDYIFISFGNIGPIVVSLNNGLLPMYTLNVFTTAHVFTTGFDDSQ